MNLLWYILWALGVAAGFVYISQPRWLSRFGLVGRRRIWLAVLGPVLVAIGFLGFRGYL